ncbi:MAG: hypothetical protein KDC44_06330 [Phaeodactylibacter sp.]|nr:hypothetical protein [Phaeodactylibacter sp.]
MSGFIKRWRATWNPNMYHGWGKSSNYFEGWYFKIVDPTEALAYAVIPGISMGPDGKQHAFIQLLDGKACKAYYYEFAAGDFQPEAQQFGLQLGNNYFSEEKIVLDLLELKGTLRFSGLHPWPKMLGAPGIMGWYGFMPFMECYHGVVSLYHQLEGTLSVKERGMVDFSGGIGYIEKDWGKSFPSAWIWNQTNHFDAAEPVNFMASVANIPWLGSHFIGYIVGFLYEGKLYRFATYTGAKMQAWVKDDEVHLGFKDRRYRLECIAKKRATGELISPISGTMTGKVNESMQAEVLVRFYDRETLQFEGVGRNAGLELAGDVDKLLTYTWRR